MIRTRTWRVRTYSQMHRTDEYSQHSSIIWPVWLNGWELVYELSGCGFEARCSPLNNYHYYTTIIEKDKYPINHTESGKDLC